MPFSGLATNRLFTPNLLGEDISDIIATLAPIEAPFLDWLGDSPVFAQNTKHEYVQDFMRPNYIMTSTAINSAASATPIAIAVQTGLGEALTVGTILENESAAPEVYQVTSIVAGGNSIVISRAYDGNAVGSLAAGGQLYVRGPAGVEGKDHGGLHTARPGVRTANTVGLFQIEIAQSGTQMAIARNTLGQESFESARAKLFRQVPSDLEKEVIRGAWNAAATLGTATTTRTMKGVRGHLTTVNSQIASASFAANPNLYIGDAWELAFRNGASEQETWAIVAGRTFFRNISALNNSNVQDSNASETYKRVIRDFAGAFGSATVFLSRVMPAEELMLVSRERVKVVPLQGRSFAYLEMGKDGDNQKGMVVGEYTNEVHHESAMARLRGGA